VSTCGFPAASLQGDLSSASLRRQLLGLASPPPAAKPPEPPPQSSLRSAGNYWGSRRPLRRQSHRSLPLKARLSGVPMSCGLSVVLLPSLRGSQACSRVIYCFAGLSVFWGSFQPMKRKRPVSRSLFTYSEAFHLLYEGSSVHAQYLSRLALYSVSFIEGLQNQGLFEF